MAVLAGVHESVIGHVGVGTGDGGWPPPLSVASVVDGVFGGTEADTPVAVRNDILGGVFKVISHKKSNSSAIPTDERQDWRFVSVSTFSPF